MTKKHTIEFVRESFEKEGYRLLSKEYLNNKNKVEYLCPEGHQHSIAFDPWQRGQRCFYCFGNIKKTIQEIRGAFKREGYKLLTTKYKNAHETNLKYICPKGHKSHIKWMDWSVGSRCLRCGMEKSAEKRRLDINDIKESFLKEGYQLLTTKYKNSRQQLNFICPNKHKHHISWDSWKRGGHCARCTRNETKTFKEVKEIFESEGYEFLATEYKDSRQKLQFICPRGHHHHIIFSEWASGVRCGECFREDRIGANHPCWKGGISREPYCDIWTDKEYKESIRERDKHQCQNPDCWKKRIGETLCVHHIDHVKKNCHPKNLISLCRSCNTRADINKDYWEMLYQNILHEKYGYNY